MQKGSFLQMDINALQYRRSISDLHDFFLKTQWITVLEFEIG